MTRASVLQVITSTRRRGAEVHAVDLDAALAKLGREVRTVALTAGPPDMELLPIPHLGERSLGWSTLNALRREASDASVLVSHGSRTLPACFAVSLVQRRRFVYRSIGDAQFYARSFARRQRVALYLRRAEAVVALFPAAADRLTQNFGVPAEHITIIPTGVPAARFPAADSARQQAARVELGLASDGPIVLCLGWLNAEKGVQFAIHAIASMKDETLLVAGDGPERAELERLAATTAPGRVHFLGSVNDPSVVLAACDVLVQPSLVEGLSAVLVEAGLSARPAVATDIGAVRDVVLDGETGVIAPPGDPAALARGLETALANGAEFGRNALAHCLRRFEIGVVAEQWNEVFAKMTPQ